MKNYLLAALFLCNTVPAGAMEMYRAQEIQPYQAQEVQPYQAQGVKPYQAQDVQPHQSQEIRQYRGDEVKPRGAQDVEPFSGGSVMPNGGEKVEIVPIRPTPALPAPPAPQPPKRKKTNGAKALVGVWQTNIPGAVYTTPSGLQGYETLHVTSGAAAGLLRINANGTYSWNSYGGKKGKWVATGDGEYPIEIIDTVENRRWRVGYSSSKNALIIWSGSIWYEGRKATVKK